MSAARKFARWLRQSLCSHAWRVSRFQALGPGRDEDCPKCGKRRHLEFSR